MAPVVSLDYLLVPCLVVGASRKCSSPGPKVVVGPRLLSSTSPPPFACLWGSLKGSSLEDISSSWSRKVTCLFGPWRLRDWECLCFGASPWSTCSHKGPQHLAGFALLAAWLNLSISCSRRWAVSNALQCASLASLRAWLCGSLFLTKVRQQDSACQWAAKCLWWLPSDLLPAWWYPTSATSAHPRKCRFPGQGPPSALAHMVGALVTSFVGTSHYRSLGPPPRRSRIPPSGWPVFFCLSILPRDWLLVASMDSPFAFFLSCLFGICQHPLQDVRMLGAICSPPRVLVKEELGIQAVFCSPILILPPLGPASWQLLSYAIYQCSVALAMHGN